MAEAIARKWVCQAWHCGEVYEGTDRWCPKCRNVSATQRSVRVRGGVLIFLGLFLVAMMAALSWYLVPLMFPVGMDSGGASFSGTNSDATWILALFGLIALFGFGALVAGYIMLRHGRQNWKLVMAMLGVIAIVFTIGWLMQRGFLLSEG